MVIRWAVPLVGLGLDCIIRRADQQSIVSHARLIWPSPGSSSLGAWYTYTGSFWVASHCPIFETIMSCCGSVG